MRETGWLIEYNVPINGLICWHGRVLQGLYATPESIDAMRFARERDAKDFIALTVGLGAIATAKEHIWDDGKAEARIGDYRQIFEAWPGQLEGKHDPRPSDFALLQAAAIYMPSAEARAAESAKAAGYTAFLRTDAYRIAVDTAEALLAEVERRRT